MSSSTDTVAITGVSACVGWRIFELTKPRIVLMVLVTAFVGFYVGSEKISDYLRLLQMLLGTAMAAGGTLALNQFLERDTDAMMERTRHRPLPDGRAAARGCVVWNRHHGRRARLSGSGRISRARGSRH